MIAKGQIQTDKSYKYTCLKCEGSGRVTSGICPQCYNLDIALLMAQFQVARGERYYALLKAILSVQGKAIYDRAQAIAKERGKFTPTDYGVLVIEFGWGNRMKPLAEWLEETGFCPSGMYEFVRDSGVKVTRLMERAKVRKGESTDAQ